MKGSRKIEEEEEGVDEGMRLRTADGAIKFGK